MSAKFKIIFSMTVFGTIGIFVKNIDLPSGKLALYRAVLATLLIVAYLLFTKQKIPFSKIKKELPILFASGIAMGINWILLFQAYRYTTISNATLSYYFAPVIVTIVSAILFHETLSLKQIICFVMATIGLLFVIGVGELNIGGTHFIGILFGLGAAVFYATVVLLNKFIENVTGIHRTLIQFLSAIVILLFYVAGTGGFTIGELNSVGWICLLIIGFIHTGIAYCLYFSSLKDLPGQTVAILSYIDPLVAVVLSVFLLKEPITWMQTFGGAMILGFTLWNEQ